MTQRDTLQCVHEPLGDAFYYGPERMSSRFENDEQARAQSGFSTSTYQTILDRIEHEGDEVCPADSRPSIIAFPLLFPWHMLRMCLMEAEYAVVFSFSTSFAVFASGAVCKSSMMNPYAQGLRLHRWHGPCRGHVSLKGMDVTMQGTR